MGCRHRWVWVRAKVRVRVKVRVRAKVRVKVRDNIFNCYFIPSQVTPRTI